MSIDYLDYSLSFHRTLPAFTSNSLVFVQGHLCECVRGCVVLAGIRVSQRAYEPRTGDSGLFSFNIKANMEFLERISFCP